MATKVASAAAVTLVAAVKLKAVKLTLVPGVTRGSGAEEAVA